MIPQKELESKVRHIQIQSRKAVLELLAGEYRSGFKGMGIEFEDVREYQHGDDVRNIDWNVTARTGHPHVKTFMEERELALYFLIDISGSTHFGTGTSTKLEVITQIFALLAFASAHNHDKVGLILFSDQIELHIKPRKGKNHILRMVEAILSHTPQSPRTDLSQALDYLNQIRPRRCVTFFFSDFLDQNYADSLRRTAHLHDLICISLTDPREQTLPSAGILEIIDSETRQLRSIDCTDTRTRQHIQQNSEIRATHLANLCHEIKADLLPLSTADDYLHEIIHFFKTRNRQSADS